MNSREKFLSVMKMPGGDYSGVEIPAVELGYWAGTVRRWSNEGFSMVRSWSNRQLRNRCRTLRLHTKVPKSIRTDPKIPKGRNINRGLLEISSTA